MSRRVRIMVQLMVLCAGWMLFSLSWESLPPEGEAGRHSDTKLVRISNYSTPIPPTKPTATDWELLSDLRGKHLSKIPTDPVPPPGILYGRLNLKNRTWSLPFISGDGLRAVADCLCDEESCVTNQVTCHIVFVKTDKLKEFINKVYPNIMTSFVLVTHNSDFTSPWADDNVRAKNGVGTKETYSFQVKKLLEDPQVLKWYGQNPSIVHPKLVPLPIGIENRYNPYGRHVQVYLDIHNENRGENARQRDKLLFANFNPKTNPIIRGEAANHVSRMASGNDAITLELQTKKKRKSPQEKLAAMTSYAEKCSQHKFCLAPPGHGIDTHRLWESFIFGCIPIVISSPMDSLFDDLPVLVVKSWSELTVERLDSEFDTFSKKTDFQLRKLYLPYWIDAIRKDSVG